jgi:hypothetical protein
MRIGNNGNVAIGTTDTATYKLNVNGTINATSILVGGSSIGSKWTGTTNIYNTALGNVGIGTTDTATYKLNVNGSSFFNGVINHNTRYRPDDNFPCNKMNLWGSGGNYGFGIDGGTLDYFTGSIHRWWYGGGGTNYGTNGMTLTNGNLNLAGSIYATTTIQASGAFYFANNL